LRETGRLDQFGDRRRGGRKAAHQIETVGVSKGAMDAAGRLDDEALSSTIAQRRRECGEALCAHRAADREEASI
jgi:hypothetical protein